MKKNLIFLALAAIGLASCNGGYKKGSHGLLYNINTDKSGPNIKYGDFIQCELVARTDGDSLLLSSYDNGSPFRIIARAQAPGDFLDVLPMLSEGDSATIKVLVDSVYKNKAQLPPNFKGKYVTYGIKVEKLISKGTLADSTFQRTIADYVKKETDKIQQAEPGKIEKYLADNNIKATKTATGLYYVITKPGVGAVPIAGDTVGVNYVLKLVNGQFLETTIKDEAIKAKKYNAMFPYTPIRVQVGLAKLIPGWDQSLMLFNKGTKATVIIPSALAYGAQGNQRLVGPYTPLVFEMEVTEIKHVDPNAPKPVVPSVAMPQPVKK